MRLLLPPLMLMLLHPPAVQLQSGLAQELRRRVESEVHSVLCECVRRRLAQALLSRRGDEPRLGARTTTDSGTTTNSATTTNSDCMQRRTGRGDAGGGPRGARERLFESEEREAFGVDLARRAGGRAAARDFIGEDDYGGGGGHGGGGHGGGDDDADDDDGSFD
jgi:hypothetical protein